MISSIAITDHPNSYRRSQHRQLSMPSMLSIAIADSTREKIHLKSPSLLKIKIENAPREEKKTEIRLQCSPIENAPPKKCQNKTSSSQKYRKYSSQKKKSKILAKIEKTKFNSNVPPSETPPKKCRNRTPSPFKKNQKYSSRKKLENLTQVFLSQRV